LSSFQYAYMPMQDDLVKYIHSLTTTVNTPGFFF